MMINMDKELLLGQGVINIWDNGKMTNNMGKELRLIRVVKLKKVFGKMVSLCMLRLSKSIRLLFNNFTKNYIISEAK